MTRLARLRPWAIAGMLGVYALAQSCTARVRPPEPAPTPALRVMTFNVDFDAPEVESALRTIEEAKAGARKQISTGHGVTATVVPALAAPRISTPFDPDAT